MTPEEKAELERLYHVIVTEKDHKKFIKLVEQLNALLQRQEIRLVQPHRDDEKG